MCVCVFVCVCVSGPVSNVYSLCPSPTLECFIYLCCTPVATCDGQPVIDCQTIKRISASTHGQCVK